MHASAASQLWETMLFLAGLQTQSGMQLSCVNPEALLAPVPLVCQELQSLSAAAQLLSPQPVDLRFHFPSPSFEFH